MINILLQVREGNLHLSATVEEFTTITEDLQPLKNRILGTDL